MSWKERKALCEKRADVQKTMRQMLDATEKEDRELNKEEEDKFEELSKQSNEITGRITKFDRMAELEAESRESDPPKPGRETLEGDPEGKEQREEATKVEEKRAEAFGSFLRHGPQELTSEQRSLIQPAGGQNTPAEVRAVQISGFGVVGTRKTYGSLVESMKVYTGVRQAGADVIMTAEGNSMMIPVSDDTSNVGELLSEGTATSSADPTVGNRGLDAYTYSSKSIAVSFQLVQDADFDVEAYIMRIAAERIGRAFNGDATNGDGSNKPNGFAKAAAANTVEAAANDAMDFDDLLDLQAGLDAAYWRDPSAGFQFNQKTMTEARKLKDNDGRPIWIPAMGDKGESIHGYPTTLNNELGSFGSAKNTVVAAFGCWSKYIVRDVTRPWIIRDPYTNAAKGQITYYVFSRHGGQLSDTKAVALLDLPTAA